MSNVEKRKKKTKYFTNDVKSLLYAYGDVEEPLPETVNAVEDIVTNYIIDLCHDAAAFAKVTRRQKIRVDDFKFTLRKDPVKFGRLMELLDLQKEINDARKAFDANEGKSMKNYTYDDDDGEDVGGDDGSRDANTTATTGGSQGTDTQKKPRKYTKKNDDPNRVKRKYTKSGKERKPYKKRAKKSESNAPVIMPAAPTMPM